MKTLSLKTKNTGDKGFVFVITLIVLLGLLLFMFVVIQLSKARVTALRNLYVTFQSGQAAFQNVPHGSEALMLGMWPLIFDGASGLVSPKNGETVVNQKFDSNGDGVKDGTFYMEYAKRVKESDSVYVRIERGETILQKLFGILEAVNTKADIVASGSSSLYSLHMDMTSTWTRMGLLVNLFDYFDVPHVGNNLVDPDRDRIRLPGYVTGYPVYTPDPDNPGSVIKNCADPEIDPDPNVPPYYGRVGVNMRNSPLVGLPNRRNGWCINPWQAVSPSDCCGFAAVNPDCVSNERIADLSVGCPSQSRILKTAYNDVWVKYKQFLELFLQYASAEYSNLELYLIGAPTPGGAIVEKKTDGSYVGGDHLIYKGSDPYTFPIEDQSIMDDLTLTQGPSNVCSPGGQFSFPTNMNLSPGRVKLAEWRGRNNPLIFSDLATTNLVNNGRGIEYLNAVKSTYKPDFDPRSCLPWSYGDLNENNHPAFAGFNLRPYPYLQGYFFSKSGKITYTYSDPNLAPVEVNWPSEYNVQADGQRIIPSVFDITLNGGPMRHFAPCLLKTAEPSYGGRDLRAVFNNSYINCRKFKSTFDDGNPHPCVNVVIALSLPSLENSNKAGLVPACTTGISYTFQQHMAFIENSLKKFDQLDDVITVVMWIGSDMSTLDPDKVKAFAKLFDYTAFPKRFLLKINAENPLTLNLRLTDSLLALASFLKETATLTQ